MALPEGFDLDEFVRRAFAEDRNTNSAKYYKIINEVPAVLMVLIVILVKVQPFGE